jgi:hypothetical protein
LLGQSLVHQKTTAGIASNASSQFRAFLRTRSYCMLIGEFPNPSLVVNHLVHYEASLAWVTNLGGNWGADSLRGAH